MSPGPVRGEASRTAAPRRQQEQERLQTIGTPLNPAEAGANADAARKKGEAWGSAGRRRAEAPALAAPASQAAAKGALEGALNSLVVPRAEQEIGLRRAQEVLKAHPELAPAVTQHVEAQRNQAQRLERELGRLVDQARVQTSPAYKQAVEGADALKADIVAVMGKSKTSAQPLTPIERELAKLKPDTVRVSDKSTNTQYPSGKYWVEVETGYASNEIKTKLVEAHMKTRGVQPQDFIIFYHESGD